MKAFLFSHPLDNVPVGIGGGPDGAYDMRQEECLQPAVLFLCLLIIEVICTTFPFLIHMPRVSVWIILDRFPLIHSP